MHSAVGAYEAGDEIQRRLDRELPDGLPEYPATQRELAYARFGLFGIKRTPIPAHVIVVQECLVELLWKSPASLRNRCPKPGLMEVK